MSVAKYDGSDARVRPGASSATVSSRWARPASTSRSRAIAVSFLVSEPIWNRVSGVTGVAWSSSAPKPWA